MDSPTGRKNRYDYEGPVPPVGNRTYEYTKIQIKIKVYNLTKGISVSKQHKAVIKRKRRKGWIERKKDELKTVRKKK
jgi:hypothetical protein